MPDMQPGDQILINGEPVTITAVNDKPLEPAPPVGPNMRVHVDMAAPGGDRSVLTDGKGTNIDVTGATPEDIDKILTRMRGPEVEIMAVNGRGVPLKQQLVQGGTTPGKSTTAAAFPPGVDLTKKLVLNTQTYKGKVGRKMGRALLKAARKAQLKHLKEIGYFKTKPEPAISTDKFINTSSTGASI